MWLFTAIYSSSAQMYPVVKLHQNRRDKMFLRLTRVIRFGQQFILNIIFVEKLIILQERLDLGPFSRCFKG